MQVYLVGGAVRDTLLGLPVWERDWLVVGASVEQLLQLGYQPVGRDFPVFLHPESKEEYALARIERKQTKGHQGFVFHTAPNITVEEDLLRRDLTINAIAQDEQGNYIDPYHGQRDLQEKWLRHVSTAFTEDPLRVFRVARFAARFASLGFRVHPTTLALMQQITASGELLSLSAERVWQECEKALLTQSPQHFFLVLRQCNALAQWFPELDRLFGVPAPEQWHPEIDTGVHVMLALQMAVQLTTDRADRLAIRFATLCHDLGKGTTPVENWPRHPQHGERGMILIEQMVKRLRIPNELAQLAALVSRYHDWLHTIEKRSAEQLMALFNGIDVWRKPQRLEQLILCSEADLRGRLGMQQQPYPQASYIKAALSIVQGVTAQSLVAQGLQGQQISTRLEQQRLASLQQWLLANKKPPST